jgi:ATP-dependent DNA helicase PIF1
MEGTSQSIFLSGKAGTGKSTLIEHFLATTDKNVLVLAPTGVAAINVGGSTIHSFFLYHPGITIDEINKEEHALKNERGDVLKEADIVIIDEVSMIRADLLDCVSKSMQLTMDNMFPFGNKQMIFVGDLYQLPPIVRREEEQFFRTKYKSPFFFSSIDYNMLQTEHVSLDHIYRQDDIVFKRILNAIRIGTVSDEDLALLNRCVEKTLPDDHIVSLVTTNKAADAINMAKLAELDTEQFYAYANIDGDVPKSFFANDTTVTFKP